MKPKKTRGIFQVRRKDGSHYPMWYGRVQVNGRRRRQPLSIYREQAQKDYDNWKSIERGSISADISWRFYTSQVLRKAKLGNPKTYNAKSLAVRMVDRYMHINMLDNMTPKVLEELQTRLMEAGHAPSSISRSIRAIKEMMRRAEDKELVRAQNWRIVKTVEPAGRLDFYEEPAFWELISKLEGVWKTAAFLMGQAGLRPGEALHLEWEDVQFNNRRIIFRSKPEYGWKIKADKKNKKIRIVGMTSRLQDHLESIARVRGFVLSDGCSRRLDSFGKQVSRALEQTKVRTYRGEYGIPYTLRHTFGSHLAQKGVSDRKIKTLMGHESIEMVEIYAHLRPVDTQEAIAMLENHVATFVPLGNHTQAPIAILSHSNEDSGNEDIPSKISEMHRELT